MVFPIINNKKLLALPRMQHELFLFSEIESYSREFFLNLQNHRKLSNATSYEGTFTLRIYKYFSILKSMFFQISNKKNVYLDVSYTHSCLALIFNEKKLLGIIIYNIYLKHIY